MDEFTRAFAVVVLLIGGVVIGYVLRCLHEMRRERMADAVQCAQQNDPMASYYRAEGE